MQSTRIPVPSKPIDIVRSILDNPRSLQHVRPLVSENFTYVSLNYANNDLKKIMPWYGSVSTIIPFLEDSFLALLSNPHLEMVI